MRISIKHIVLFLILFLFVSCTNENRSKSKQNKFPEKIILNPSEAITDMIDLSDIAEKVEYIPLQSSDSSSLGNFYYFVVTNDCFFIQHELGILRFDKYGRFINKLFNVGRGPGETGARSFTIDEVKEIVYALDIFNGDIKIYNYDGKFIKSINKQINAPENMTTSIGFFNNNLFISTAQKPFSKYIYSCFNLANDSIRIICKNSNSYDKLQEKQHPVFINTIDYNYQISDSSVMFKEWFCDTIFSMHKDYEQKPRYLTCLGPQKLEWTDWRDHGMFNLKSGPPYGYWVQSFKETKSFLFLVLKSFKEPKIFVILNKGNGSVKMSTLKSFDVADNRVFLKNDLDNLIPFSPMSESEGNLFYYNNCLYSVIDAMDFVKAYHSASEKTRNSSGYLKSMAPVFSKITEFSNPVIMKVYLK